MEIEEDIDEDGPLLPELFTVGGFDEATGVFWDGTTEGDEDDEVETETFAETPEIPGADSKRAEQLLSAALKQGAAKLQGLCRQAVERHGEGLVDAESLFSEEERQALADQIAATSATAELLGRSRIRENEAAVLRRHDFAAFAYDPSQARDDQGEWTDGGGSSGGKPAKPRKKPKPASVTEAKDRIAALYPKVIDDDVTEDDIKEAVKDLAELKPSKADLTEVLQRLGTMTPPKNKVEALAKIEQKMMGRKGAFWRNKDFASFAYDPSQPRDDQGQWGEGGAGGAPKKGASKSKVSKKSRIMLVRKTFSEVPFHTFDEGGPLGPLAPTRAIAYFRRLVPTLSVPDSWAAALTENAFVIAGITEQTILDRLKAVIQGRLETGEDARGAVREIGALLDEAGLTERNPQRAEMLIRTSMMESYNGGAEEEGLEVAEVFPAWQYFNPDDGRGRPTHAERNRKFYRNRIGSQFSDVRGRDIGEKANCRCNHRYVDRYEWAELQAAGATVEDSW